MQRRNRIVSIPGILILVLLFAGLGAALWRSGGLAFSPGSLSAKSRAGLVLQGYESHAEFEQNCQLCHQPLETGQAELCLDCHMPVEVQIQTGSSLHGVIERADRCSDCHSEHQGRDFDLLRDALVRFDHSVTTFSLDWHQLDYDAAPMKCTGCHAMAPEFSFTVEKCEECHRTEDSDFIQQHVRDFGKACLDCHDGKDRMTGFDHQTTGFPLQGKHAAVACVGCHAGVGFENTPSQCMDCHAEPEIHRGAFNSECVSCHSPQAWKPASLNGRHFIHAVQAGFSLERHGIDYAGALMTCKSCHPDSIDVFGLPACIDCHANQEAAFMDQHTSQFGTECLACHDGVDRMSNFEHNRVFPLEGRHAEIKCETCHAEKSFQGTPADCGGCHAEPEIHAGFFGAQCQYCHTSTSWTPAQMRMHNFPPDHGGQGLIDCQTCHLDTYVDYTCFGCHEHQTQPVAESHAQAGITAEELPACAQCHPAGLIEENGR
jgi:hypothetical protein